MTGLQVILRILAVPVLLVSIFFSISYGQIALQGGTFQLGLGIGLAVLSVLGGSLLSIALWWMGDIHQYLDRLTSD
jgi:uncharacterized integral membrane protein